MGKGTMDEASAALRRWQCLAGGVGAFGAFGAFGAGLGLATSASAQSPVVAAALTAQTTEGPYYWKACRCAATASKA
jgi:hypothetical protein